MAYTTEFFKVLKENNIEFFTGVPDSYLNGFCKYLLDNVDKKNNIIAANEGNAIGIAAGYYLATQKIPLVYMQNSGLGNTVNPIASLSDKSVYDLPFILLIGWRGQPDTGDWPQHELQGNITIDLLKLLNITPFVLSDNYDENNKLVEEAINLAKQGNRTAIISPNKILTEKKTNDFESNYPMSRSKAMEAVLNHFEKNTIYSASTGRMTRELYHLRKFRNETHENDYLNVGSMGHAASVALGIAVECPNENIVCLDGDASVVMHMGQLTMMSQQKLNHFTHIIFNNGVHESVGGQPSVGFNINFTEIAKGCGYNTIDSYVTTEDELVEALNKLSQLNGPKFLEIRIKQGIDRNLPELNISHKELIDDLKLRLEGAKHE